MASAHASSGQSWSAATGSLLALPLVLLAACGATGVPASQWPPADFELSVAEQEPLVSAAAGIRCFRVRADGLVVYGTAAHQLGGEHPGPGVPVLSRMAIYELVPECTRSLAMFLERSRIREQDPTQGRAAEGDGGCVVVRFHAFGATTEVSLHGRVHGAMAGILGLVNAHLPAGEAFAAAGAEERSRPSLLRSVPAPVDDAAGALAAVESLLAQSPGDRFLLQQAFALACYLQRRPQAEQWWARWSEAENSVAEVDRSAAWRPDLLGTLMPAGGAPRQP
jgi:hypothetical protein